MDIQQTLISTQFSWQPTAHFMRCAKSLYYCRFCQLYCLLQDTQIFSPSESSAPLPHRTFAETVQKWGSVATDIFLPLGIHYSSIPSAGLVNARRKAKTVKLRISLSLFQLAQHFLLVWGMDHAKKISTMMNFDVDMDDCRKLKILCGGGGVFMLRVVSTTTCLWHCRPEKSDGQTTKIQGNAYTDGRPFSPLSTDNIDNYAL